MAITSLAGLKRTLTVGTEVQVDNLLHPNLSAERTVLTAQSNSVCLSFPPGHKHHKENPGPRDGSWVTYPKRDQLRFDGDTVVFLDERGQEWLKLTPKAAS